jgi:hypothetical protein
MTAACATPHPLASFIDGLAALPARHPRRIGLALIQAGTCAAMAALCVSIIVLHAAMVVMVLGLLLARPPIHRLPGFWFGIAFALWQGLSGLVGPDAAEFLGSGWLFIWLSAYTAAVGFLAPGVRRWGLRLLVAAVTASAILAVIQFTVGWADIRPFRVHGPPLGQRFLHGTGFFHIRLAQGIIMGMIAVALSVDWHGELPRWSLWLGRIAANGGVVLSTARSAVLGLAAGLAASCCGRGRRFFIIGLVLSAAALAIGLGLIWCLEAQRIRDMFAGNSLRQHIWRISGMVIAERPLFGAGGQEAFHQRYLQLVPVYFDRHPVSAAEREAFDYDAAHDGAAHAHNGPMACAAEYGIPAAGCFLAWLGALAWFAYRRRASAPAAWSMALGVVAVVLVAGMFERYSSATFYGIAVLMGLTVSLAIRPDRESAAGGGMREGAMSVSDPPRPPADG